MLIACGDALIDFVPTRNAEGRDAVMPAVGGSCLNVAIGMARLGAPTGFVGGISTDMFGRMIADHAAASNVELALATRSDHQTTLAFVRIVAGESHYAFYDAETATRNWTYRRGSIPFDACRGRSMSARPRSSTTRARPRPKPWSRTHARRRPSPSIRTAGPTWCRTSRPISRAWPSSRPADLIKMSDVDFAYLFGDEPYQQRASALLGRARASSSSPAATTAQSPGTRGQGRSRSQRPRSRSPTPSAPATVFRRRCCSPCTSRAAQPGSLKDIGADELRRALSFAANCAGLTCTRPGADPPWSHEVTWGV